MIQKTNNKSVDTALTIAIIIAIIWALNYILKLIKNVGSAVTDPLGHDKYTPDSTFNDLDVDYKKTNYPETTFRGWADALDTAMTTPFYLDIQTIRNIMYQINNDEDYKALLKAFGLRSTMLGQFGDNGNLPYFIHKFVPQEDINGFNYHYQGWNMKNRI